MLLPSSLMHSIASRLNVPGAILATRMAQESTYEDALDTTLTNYVAFIGFTILIWDHLITLDEEIRYIWSGRKSTLVYLFLLNRYFTPLGFIGNLTAYFSDWSFMGCNHFVRFEGATVSIAIEVTGLMMLMRVRALYADKPSVIWVVAFILAVETAVNAWLLTHGEAVQHGPGVHACSMIFDPNLHFLPSLSAWIPLFYDTVVILLTLYRCVGPVKRRTAGHIVRTLLRDGLLYYSVIFAVNFVLAIMIVSTPPGIKNIAAQLEQLLTVAMMSRITLSLKREAVSDPDSDRRFDTYLFPDKSDSHAVNVQLSDRGWLARPTRDPHASSGWRVTEISADETGTTLPLPNKVLDWEARRTAEESQIGDTDFQGLSERNTYELRTLRASKIDGALIKPH